MFPYRYRALAALAFASGLLAYFGRGLWIIDAFAANISAGFIGALATVVVIDRAAEKRAEETRRRVELVATEQSTHPLGRLSLTLANMIKASSVDDTQLDMTTFRALFAPAATDCLDWLDLEAASGVLGEDRWYGLISVMCESASKQLSAVVDKYVAFLSPDFLEAIEDFRRDAFFYFLMNIKRSREAVLKATLPNRQTLNGTKEMRDAFFRKLCTLIDLHDRLAHQPLSFPQTLQRKDIMPRAGSARCQQLPPPILVGKGPPPAGRIDNPMPPPATA